SQDGSVAAFNDCGATSEVGLKLRKLNEGGGARVLRRSRQPYAANRILYLPMPLRYSCYDVDCECDDRTDPAKCPRVKHPECSGGDCTWKGGRCVGHDSVSEGIIGA